MARVAAGDRAAFDELVAHHQAAVLRLARSWCRAEASAEDVLQETFLAAWRGAAGWRGESSVRGWLFTIARNAAFRMRRRLRPDDAADEPPDELATAAGWGAAPGPEGEAMAAQNRERLSAALESLSEEEREVLLLHDVEQLSGEETAGTLGLSIAAMKSRLHRARLHLAAVVRRGGDHGRGT